MIKQRIVKNGKLTILNEKNEELLSICEKIESGTMQMMVSGNITADVAHEFEDELMTAMTICQSIEIDFEGVTGITSAGLKVLLSAQKMVDELEGSMKLKKLKENVLKAFEEVGFDGLFDIEETN